MAYERIPFPEMEWRPGEVNPQERKKLAATGAARMLEFAPGFADPQWCRNGHIGLVLEGTLALEFERETLRLNPGDGFSIDPATPHRASNPGPAPTTLFIVPR